jgi:hypothetical protein
MKLKKPMKSELEAGAIVGDLRTLEPHYGDVASIVAELRSCQAQRRAMERMVYRSRNCARAFVRGQLGWRVDLPEKERAKINRDAERIVTEVLGGREQTDIHVAHAIEASVAPFVLRCEQSAKLYEDFQRELETQMRHLAEQLPAAGWIESVKGFGLLGLGVVAGEAGNLSDYPNPAKLWTRFGLAPRPCYAMTTKSGETAFAEPKVRRSMIWRQASSMIKTNFDGNGENKTDGPYRQVYVARKAYENARTDEGRPKSLKHADNRAMRYMIKRFLKDLWRAWTRAPIVEFGGEDVTALQTVGAGN